MAFQAGLDRRWYVKGRVAARGPWRDMVEAWHAALNKPKTPGKRVTAQESFYQGYFDSQEGRSGKQSPASAVPTHEVSGFVRRLPSGQIQVKIPLSSLRRKRAN